MATGTRSITTDDKAKLKAALIQLCGVDESTYDDNPVVLALTEAGIESWRDFLTMSKEQIYSLKEPPDGATPAQELTLHAYSQLLCLQAFYHFISRRNAGAVNIASTTKDMWNDFRTGEYNPNAELVPWNSKKDAPDTKAQELASWRRNVRPSPKDYREFRDINHWVRHREHIETTVKSHGLSHILDATFVPTNNDLDDQQKDWMFKVFEDTMKQPAARLIVTKYKETHDTRALWTELKDTLGSSMTSELNAQKISTYMTSTRLHTMGWRGTQENFLLHYAEQARIYNEISPTA